MTRNNSSASKWKTWKAGDAILSISPGIIRLQGFGLQRGESGTDIPFHAFLLPNSDGDRAVRKHMGDRIASDVISAVRKKQIAAWHKGAFSVNVRPSEVCLGIENPHGGEGTSWSREEFLKNHQPGVEKTFGPEVLRELLAELEDGG